MQLLQNISENTIFGHVMEVYTFVESKDNFCGNIKNKASTCSLHFRLLLVKTIIAYTLFTYKQNQFPAQAKCNGLFIPKKAKMKCHEESSLLCCASLKQE